MWRPQGAAPGPDHGYMGTATMPMMYQYSRTVVLQRTSECGPGSSGGGSEAGGLGYFGTRADYESELGRKVGSELNVCMTVSTIVN